MTQRYSARNPVGGWIGSLPVARFLLILLLGLLCLVPVIGQSQVPSSPADISKRIAELKDPEKNIPENQILLSDELRRSDDEIERYRATQTNYEADQNKLDELKGTAAKVFQDINDLNCDQVRGTLPETAKLDEVVNSILGITAFYTAPNPWAELDVQDDQVLSPKAQCEALKNAIGDSAKRGRLLSFLDTMIQELEATKTQLDPLIDALQKRRAALLQHLSATAQTTVSGDLWRIILVIGLLGIGTIVATRLFTPEIQNHWVLSGQVIQFVTVMILLSVIMALGLAGILKENTLGTLLGGIAGYVLSQGVGKAAAAAVTQGLAAGGTGAGALPPIALTSLSPTTGPVGGGTAVKLTGSGFAPGATVTFGGTPAPASDITNTTIDVTTPAHAAGAVEVVVTNTNGQAGRLPDAFTYQ